MSMLRVRRDRHIVILVILVTFLLMCSGLFSGACVEAAPVGSPDAVVQNMQQIPQWHCLRYRRFDLVRRCRNYRIQRH